MTERRLVTGIDLGSSKVAAAIGALTDDQEVEVLGFGSCPAKGIRRGIVVNLEALVGCIEDAVEEAETMARTRVRSVFANVSGNHVRGINSRGMTSVSSRDMEISNRDVSRVIKAAKAINFPMDREVLHVFPQEFIVDGLRGIEHPVGMTGVRLEAEVHIVTGSTTSIQNVVKSVHKAGFEVEQLMFGPMAASMTCLRPEEKDLGCLLVDMGAGTTDVLVFSGGSLRHSCVIGKGGDHISHDIAVVLRIGMDQAEELKKNAGCAFASFVSRSETVNVPLEEEGRSKTISRSYIGEIIEPRVEQLFDAVGEEIRRSGVDKLIGSGVVLTGGCTQLEGVVELAEQCLKMPARKAYPRNVYGLEDVLKDSGSTVSVGLVVYGLKYRSARKSVLFKGDGLLARYGNRIAEAVSWLGDHL